MVQIHPDRLTLESAEEVAAFNALVDAARRWDESQKQRAERVLRAFLDGEVKVDVEDRNDSASVSTYKWAEALNRAIAEDLDHRSIGRFVELVIERAEQAAQAARAYRRHAEHRDMKAQVFNWLDANMSRFRSMDAAAEAIAGKVAPIAFRTARDWVTEWKRVRSPGTP